MTVSLRVIPPGKVANLKETKLIRCFRCADDESFNMSKITVAKRDGKGCSSLALTRTLIDQTGAYRDLSPSEYPGVPDYF